MTTPSISGFFSRIRLLATGTALVLLASFGAVAQEAGDPPGRVARLTLAEGAVSFAEAGGNDWTNAQFTRPMTGGDRLWVDKGSRGELHAGSTALRLGALTHMEIMALDDQSTELNLTQGSLSVRVREMQAGERLEIGTPNLAVSITQPGEYRIDVDPTRETTRVAVHAGAATVYGENREAANLSPQQQMSFAQRNLTPAAPNAYLQRDALDQWAADRDRLEDQSVTARYVSRDVVGYQQLDQHGEWRTDPGYGPVWYPRVTVADWAPYRYGQWRWISPWGWTWIDDAPWGFAPFHYGRWAQVGPRWGWVPGPRTHRPVYAPALVAFVGGNGSGANWNISVGPGSPGVAWFPLGPGDAFRPGYRASRRYFDNVNRSVVVSNNPGQLYANQRRPGAVTAVSAEDFGRGRPGRGFQRVPDAELARARVVEPPPTPGRGAGTGPSERPAPARALPPTAVLNQPAPPAPAVGAVPSRFGRFGAPDGRREDRRDGRREERREDRPGQPDGNRATGLQRDPAEAVQRQQQQLQARQAEQAQQAQRAQQAQQAQELQARQQRMAQDQQERMHRRTQEQQERGQQHQQERLERMQRPPQMQVPPARPPGLANPQAAPSAPPALAQPQAPQPAAQLRGEGRRPPGDVPNRGERRQRGDGN